MLYADTSALAKLVIAEAESDALRRWLSRRSDLRLVTNLVGVVELRRMAMRAGPDAEVAAQVVLSGVDRMLLTAFAMEAAASLRPSHVRTLDALHLGSAAEVVDLEALLSYDARMISAAEGLGLSVISPG